MKSQKSVDKHRLVNLDRSVSKSESRTRFLAALFEKVPESVQKAVVELLKSATGEKE